MRVKTRRMKTGAKRVLSKNPMSVDTVTMGLPLGAAPRNRVVPKGLGNSGGGEEEKGDMVESVMRLAWLPHMVFEPLCGLV